MVLCEELYKLCLIYFSTSLLHWHYYYFSQMLSRTLRVDTLVTGIVILAPGPKLSDTAILPPEYPVGTCVFGSLVISVINYSVLLVYFKLMEKSKKNKSQTHRIQNADRVWLYFKRLKKKIPFLQQNNDIWPHVSLSHRIIQGFWVI